MRDDFQIPNLGQAPDKYDIGFFNRFAKNIENMMQTVRSKGRGIFADVQTDSLEVTGPITVTGDTAFTGDLAVTGALSVSGTSTLHGVNMTGDLAVTGTLGVAGATTLTTMSATTSATTPLLSGTTSTTTPVVITPAIQFPATQVPSAGANTLDDYEEGTWTPTITATSGTITTSTTNFARYTKIGRVVHATFDISISAVGTGTGNVNLTMPFTNNNMTGEGIGREVQTGGNALIVQLAASTANATLIYYNNNPTMGALRYIGTITYFV